jgi:5-methylcytosine-specific restriction endonuclease McrA
MPYKNLKHRKNFNKRYYLYNREALLKQKKEYRLKNIKKFKEKDKKYYINNKHKINECKKQWCKKNREHMRIHINAKRAKYMKSWEGLIPKETKCQICGRKIYFNKPIKRPSESIHFDHRLEGKELIKEHPGGWLRAHPRNSKNERLWKQSNFGMLCRSCNGFLLTRNRKTMLLKIIKYVFGEAWKKI